MRLAPWDVRLAARTAAIAAVSLAVIALVEGFTSERGGAAATTGAAIGPWPLAPLAAAISVALALVPARSSGELRALAALGAGPVRARLAAIAVGGALGLIGAIGLATGRIDATPLYPAPRARSDWRAIEGASGVEFVSASRRARFASERLERDGASRELTPPEPLPPHGRAAAALAVALAAIALSTYAASPRRRRPLRTIVGFALYGATQVAAFQLAGARALPAVAVAAPPAALWIVAAWELSALRRLSADEAWL